MVVHLARASREQKETIEDEEGDILKRRKSSVAGIDKTTMATIGPELNSIWYVITKEIYRLCDRELSSR